MSEPLTIVWFRQDLRLDDNPALASAAERGRVLPLFIDTTAYQKSWVPGEASRWWLGRSLQSLDRSLRAIGSRLVAAAGDATTVLIETARKSGADCVYWNRRYEPSASRHDERVKASMAAAGLRAVSFNGRLLREPWEVRNRSGGCYRVFTPYYRAVRAGLDPKPLERPKSLRAPATWPRSEAIESLAAARSSPAAASKLSEHWQPGEQQALERTQLLDADFCAAYPSRRDRPGIAGTSRLSAHLRFGEISVNRLFATLKRRADETSDRAVHEGSEAILRQLVWRDFAYHILYHFPHTPDAPLHERFSRVTWREDPDALAAWTRGLTGYPLVDAGMRQLQATGWMHNRVRMIAASFLSKDLLIDWREGARVFWDRLVDADLANNTFGWQWAAGCGADAAPYFRIFNPSAQAERFDGDGSYIRKWLPQLAGLPDKHLRSPQGAPPEVLQSAGVVLGRDYPEPIVDRRFARDRALRAFKVLKS